MPDATRHLTLSNGLQLTLRHAPRLKRAAAAIRVHAGSHDAPTKWPGLAHFLEHLFFLGTHRFPLTDGLMRYVQGLGGQVNASTRERTTDFSSKSRHTRWQVVLSACARCWRNLT